MQFKFYDDPDDNGWGETGSAFGYAAEDIGPEKTFGFRVDFDDNQAAQGWVDFTIPELRQMLAEAEELAEKEQCANCDCDGCTFAPLADEDELAQDFENRAAADKAIQFGVEALLRKAEEALDREGDASLAKAYVDLAYARARNGLLGQ